MVTSAPLPMRPWRWTDPKATRAFTCVLAQGACVLAEALIWRLIAALGWLEWPANLFGILVLMVTLSVAASAFIGFGFVSVTSALESLLDRGDRVVVAYLSLAIELAALVAIAWILA